MALKDIQDLAAAVQSSTPIIAIESFEEKRALELIVKASKASKKPAYRWSTTEGLSRVGLNIDYGSQKDSRDPIDLISCIKDIREPSIIVVCDAHPYLDKHYSNQPLFVRGLKDIAQGWRSIHHKIVLLSHKVSLPAELSRSAMQFKLSLPSKAETLNIIKEEAKKWSRDNKGQRIKTDPGVLERAVNNLQGMTYDDTRALARGMLQDGAISDCDLPEVNRMKYQLMDMDSVLSFEYDTESFSNVAGLSVLKQWLAHRKTSFLDIDDGDTPKGVMLLGVQGAGKSLAAKAIAGAWGCALMRLDFAALYNKYIGETERQLREALAQAEAMSPCVLWIDEIEKGLAQGSDEGTGRRTLGTLLTWLSEHNAQVFLVATSNDIQTLPPELIRKGRLDEIFFVDLPTPSVREEIFKIHLSKRSLKVSDYSLSQLAELSEGFSGAEIEQAVISALYKAKAMDKNCDQEVIEHALVETRPLSVVMAEQVAALRNWAADRTVNAD